MNEELTAEQACRQHLLAPEDFSKDCNIDGSLKSQPKTTTITLRNDESKSITVNTAVLQASLAGAVILIVVTAILIIKWLVKKKR